MCGFSTWIYWYEQDGIKLSLYFILPFISSVDLISFHFFPNHCICSVVIELQFCWYCLNYDDLKSCVA